VGRAAGSPAAPHDVLTLHIDLHAQRDVIGDIRRVALRAFSVIWLPRVTDDALADSLN
jgi:hypothetical protein